MIVLTIIGLETMIQINSGEIDWHDEVDDSMDGDAESAFGSCGWGVDEQYEHNCDYGDDW